MVIIRDKLFIGGEWVDPAGTGRVEVISPITEELYGSVPEAGPADIDRAVAAARRAFDEGPWPAMPIADRAAYLIRMAALLEPRLAEAVDLQINEMGGARRWMQPATLGLAGQVRQAIALAGAVPTREVRDGAIGKVVVLREPIGVIGSVMPWNSPFSGVMIRLLPALLAGCPIIIKPAPETPLTAYLVADALAELDLPPGLVSFIPGGREAGRYLVSHPGVDKVSFTGSTAAGRSVGAICGEQVKPVILELGGKSAAIVLDDVDLEKAVPQIIFASLYNTGQACIATTRILAPASRHDEVVDALAAAVGAMKVGNPLDADTDFGPLVTARQRDRVEAYIRLGLEEGAKPVLGATPPPFDRGWYVSPTIFAGVDNGMRIAREEIFGPVLAVIRYETVADAVRIANDSIYGLGGAVFTGDEARGLEVAGRIRTGTCLVNGGTIVGGGGPFGGYKQSGVGRVLGPEGMAAHYQLKSVSLGPGVVPLQSG